MKNEPENGKRGRGRPSKFEGIDLTLVRKYATAGLTDQQIAELLGIAVSTLNEYKKNDDFSESLKAGKAHSNGKVVDALYQRALGYSHPETKVFCYEGCTITEEVTRHHPPDVTACIFWLKNRQRDEWRDKVDHEHSGTLDVEHSAKESLIGKLRDAIAKRNPETTADGELVSEPDGDAAS